MKRGCTPIVPQVKIRRIITASITAHKFSRVKIDERKKSMILLRPDIHPLRFGERMKKIFLLISVLLLITSCSSAKSGNATVESTAKEQMAADGFADAAITTTVKGDPGVRGADELYCVATDATTQNGELPYLLVVWRSGDSWSATQLLDGYYEWDLQGCPR
jgi:hypothetical protein